MQWVVDSTALADDWTAVGHLRSSVVAVRLGIVGTCFRQACELCVHTGLLHYPNAIVFSSLRPDGSVNSARARHWGVASGAESGTTAVEISGGVYLRRPVGSTVSSCMIGPMARHY